MRITDSRYDRDRLRLAVAYRMIGLEARTRTIRQATQLSDDRIRRMYRDYFASGVDNSVRRRRGKSPRQMNFFRRSLAHEQQAALLGSVASVCGLIVRSAQPFRPSLELTWQFCNCYETFTALWPGTDISFEHAWHLWQVFCRDEEHVLATCPDCQSRWMRDTLEILPDNCPACRSGFFTGAPPVPAAAPVAAR